MATMIKRTPYSKADIEQVQNVKKPFTLHCVRCRTIPHDSGEVHRWNQSSSNAWITWD
jgi:hypothetical protein